VRDGYNNNKTRVVRVVQMAGLVVFGFETGRLPVFTRGISGSFRRHRRAGTVSARLANEQKQKLVPRTYFFIS